jgi:metal-responsive CopG/Arc/MetJ family transcriptional regulator
MATVKVAISIDREIVHRVDELVAEGKFSSRSRAFQLALEAQIERIDKRRLARESAKLDRRLEQQLAEEGASYDLEGWPEY